jgi:DNA-3-methyladenine glycosylase II
LFPSPEAVLALSDDEFDVLCMKFFRGGLRSAAGASLKAAADWTGMTGEQLVAAAPGVRRIGPWTAGATLADVTNDYSLYPFADLAVRTWAGKLAPSVSWPKSESEFGRLWQAMAGAQLSEWTLLTLALGVRHATGVAL